MIQTIKTKGKRPRIKIEKKTIDWIAELIAFVFLVMLVALPLIFLKELPERIPVHFNLAGQTDSYGSRSTMWLLPLLGLFIYIGMTIIERFPHIYNYPVEITEKNALKQYIIATRLIRILKTVILIIFSFITWQTIKTAKGNTSGLGKVFLPVFLLFIFGIVLIYIVKSLNNRHID